MLSIGLSKQEDSLAMKRGNITEDITQESRGDIITNRVKLFKSYRK